MGTDCVTGNDLKEIMLELELDWRNIGMIQLYYNYRVLIWPPQENGDHHGTNVYTVECDGDSDIMFLKYLWECLSGDTEHRVPLMNKRGNEGKREKRGGQASPHCSKLWKMWATGLGGLVYMLSGSDIEEWSRTILGLYDFHLINQLETLLLRQSPDHAYFISIRSLS